MTRDAQIASERAWLVERRACVPALDWLAEHGLTIEEAWHRDDVLAEWQIWLARKAGVPARMLARAAYGLALDVQDLAPAESRAALTVVGRWLGGEAVSVEELQRATKAAEAAWAAKAAWAAEATKAEAWAAAWAAEATKAAAEAAAWAAAWAAWAAEATKAAAVAAAWAEVAWAAAEAAEAAAEAAPEHRARRAQIVRDVIPWAEVERGIGS